MRVLLTGATGFIGSAIVARLLAEGHEAVGVARRRGQSRAGLRWIALDLREAILPKHWLSHLDGVDVVINCAGALQDSPFDSTAAVHAEAPAALFAACEQVGVARVIHVSAIGVNREAPTEFSRTKAKGDRALMATGLDWVILRPSVVVGRPAYGGSALFRGLARLPVVPHVTEAGKLQVVQLDDLVATVTWFLKAAAPARVQLDIAGPEPLSFNEVVAAYRSWFGWRPAQQVHVPPWIMNLTYRIGDLAGWLGWRPPMRTTAQKEILRGAVGDPSEWTTMTGIRPRSLEAALSANPVGVQERWFSGLYLLKPIVLGVLSLFWIATALVSLGPGWDIGVGLMHIGGVTGLGAALTVVAGAIADLAIGIGIAFRRTARQALYAALAFSLLYSAVGTVLVPQLWIDPLGPLLKIWPILVLNLVALAILEDR